jgi:AcrR family transcriptional regulator
MGITERREREKEDVRRKILDAAHDLFEVHGYENVTMRAVGDAIEYSPTTIYHHFANKDALVEALCLEDFERLSAAMNSKPLPEDPIDRMRALGRAYAAFGMANPNHYRFMFMTAGDWKTHANDDGAPPARSYAVLRQAVVDAMDQGFFERDDVDLVSQVVWSAIHGVVSLVITFKPEQFPRAPPRPGLVDASIDATLHGLLINRKKGAR